MSIQNPTSIERFKLLLISIIAAVLIASALESLIDVGGSDHIELVCGGFSILFPLLGHLIFPLLYLIGLLLSWYQFSGMESWWLDLGEVIAIAGLGYAVAEAIVFRDRKSIDRRDERARKIMHIVSNLFTCLLIWIFGIQATSVFVLSVTVMEILLFHLAASGVKVPGMEEWVKNVGREGEIPGEGALYNALGVLFTLGLLRDNPLAAISVIVILAMGDGLATFIGCSYGRHRIPWNKDKTLEGMIGFAAGAIFAYLVLPVPETILIVLLAAVVESLPLKANDNIILPVVSSLLYFMML